MSLKHAITFDAIRFSALLDEGKVSGTSCELLDEDVTTYQERLDSYLKKMLQRSRKRLACYLKKM